MRMPRALIIFCCAVLSPICGVTQSDSLRIGPGDVLSVQVFDTPNMNETARVTDAGMFPLILAGIVHLEGLTTEEAAHVIEKQLIRDQIMYHPQILVTVVQYATENVTVFGQVVRPGTYPIDTPRSVLDVLSLAGGLTPTADRHITIERHQDGTSVAYFVSNSAQVDLNTAPFIYPGDRIVIPQEPVAYVLGAVFRPGGYPSIGNDSRLTVLQAIAQAQGTEPSAVPADAKLIRPNGSGGYIAMKLPLSKMQKGKSPDIVLEPNDIVYVPFSYLRNALSLGLPSIAASATTAAVYAH